MGPIATVLVQRHSSVGDAFVVGELSGRVRAHYRYGKKTTEAGPSVPVEGDPG